MLDVSLDQYGGIGDGRFDNSHAFLRALEDIGRQGGGTLTVPSGIWRTGPIDLFDNCALELLEGSVISFIAEFQRYTPVWTRWEGIDCHAMRPCLQARNAHHVSISGHGVIDGGGSTWWTYRRNIQHREVPGPLSEIELGFAALNPDYRDQPGGGGGRASQFLAPSCIQFYQCSQVSVSGISIINSPFWTLHPIYCDFVEVRNVTIENPYDAPNTDGIDIDSCTNVTIGSCHIDVGDDAIALKSGSGQQGVDQAKETAFVHVSDCTVAHAHGGIVIGSETAGGIHDVIAWNCSFLGTDRGIRIKTRRGRGGAIHDLQFSGMEMIDNLCPVSINMYYRCGVLDCERERAFALTSQEIIDTTPSIWNVEIRNLHSIRSKASCGFFVGLPESPLSDIRLYNCHFSHDEFSTVSPDESEMYEGLPSVSSSAIRIRFCDGIQLNGILIEGPDIPYILEEGARLKD
jgi:polygalacturonase